MGSPFISKASNTSPRRSTALLLGIEGGREGGKEGTYRGMGSPFISNASNTSPRRSTALLLGIEGGREGGREERNIPWDRLAIHLEG